MRVLSGQTSSQTALSCHAGGQVQENIISLSNNSGDPRSPSCLYTDFTSDIHWIKDSIRDDLSTLPVSMHGVSRYYVSDRVKVLPDDSSLYPSDPLSPSPIPYLAFWFAHDFGIEDVQVRRLLGLGLVYVCLSSSPRDDLVDGSGFPPHQLRYLAHWFWEKYIDALKKLFPAGSSIWQFVLKSAADWERYERWTRSHKKHITADPLSPAFLENASRYLCALLFPALAAVALLSNRAARVRAIRRFVCYYCMGWRILDDLRDWREDLEANTHTSCVLALLRIRAGIPQSVPLSRGLAVALFSDQVVVGEIYSAMVRFCHAARSEAASLQADYVTRFIDEQLLGYQTELARMTAEKANFGRSLARLLQVDMGGCRHSSQ